MLIYLSKLRLAVLIIFGTLISISATAQKDTVTIKEVEVSSDRMPVLYSQTSRIISVITKEEIKRIPAQGIDDVLKYALNADVRSRGEFGIQSDISIRGGSAEQTLILINGVKINDPQTGHHNINIPVDLNDIERIEILEGPGSRIFGPDAFSGAINIITSSHDKDNVQLSLAGGENNYYSLNASGTYNTGKLSNYLSVNQKASDGYMKDTDFKINNFLYQGDYKRKRLSFNLMASYLNKAYGASNFYSAKYANEYEHTKTSFVNMKMTFGKQFHTASNIYWRVNQDKFILKRDNPSFYTNYHLTSIAGADINTWFENKLGRTAIGGEYRREGILSNRLGELLDDTIRYPHISWGFFNHGKVRENLNFFAEHLINIAHFSCNPGFLANYSSDYNFNIYPGIDASYEFVKHFRLYASVNKSLRLPTFTDLYYQDPSHLGNTSLKPEEAVTYETGIKYSGAYINSHISVFRRYGKNIIDWVWINKDTTQSTNLTSLTTDGIEFSADVFFDKIYHSAFIIKHLSVSYSYLNTDRSSGVFKSYYALDYLRQKASLTVYHRIYKNISATWAYSYNERAGTYKDASKADRSYKPYSLLNGRITYNRNKKQETRNKVLYNFYLEASNIFNTPYNDIGNVTMPGRWVKAGVIINYE